MCLVYRSHNLENVVLRPDLKGSSVVKQDPLAEEFKYDSQDYCPAIATDDYDDDACGEFS